MCSPHYGWFRMQDTQWEPSGYQLIPIFPICLQTWSIGASHESCLLKNCRTCGTSEQRRMQSDSTMSESCSRKNTKYIYSHYYNIITSKIAAAQYLDLPCKDLKGSFYDGILWWYLLLKNRASVWKAELCELLVWTLYNISNFWLELQTTFKLLVWTFCWFPSLNIITSYL